MGGGDQAEADPDYLSMALARRTPRFGDRVWGEAHKRKRGPSTDHVSTRRFPPRTTTRDGHQAPAKPRERSEEARLSCEFDLSLIASPGRTGFS